MELGNTTEGLPLHPGQVSLPPTGAVTGEGPTGAYFRMFPERFRSQPVPPFYQVPGEDDGEGGAVFEDANGDRWHLGKSAQEGWKMFSTLDQHDPDAWMALNPGKGRP